MQWQDLPASENIEDRRAEWPPWWSYFGPEMQRVHDELADPQMHPRTRMQNRWENERKIIDYIMHQTDPGKTPLGTALGREDIQRQQARDIQVLLEKFRGQR